MIGLDAGAEPLPVDPPRTGFAQPGLANAGRRKDKIRVQDL